MRPTTPNLDWRVGLNRDPETRSWIAAVLANGEALGFYILEPDGSKSLSHVVQRIRGRFYVTGMDDAPLGSFATLARANVEGFTASSPTLHHGL